MDLHSKAFRRQKDPYIGNVYQLGGTRHYSLTSGRSNGCRCVDVKTGSGLEYTVVCDRGMDISLASYRGMNLVFLTDEAEAHPSFYDPWESEWLRTFSAGLLTTCGPSYLGHPCEDQGERLGLHGRFSALPAHQVCDLSDFASGILHLKGQLHEAHPFGDKLRIQRSIQSNYGESKIWIEDTIRNMGGKPAPVTVLYHVNFGYPFLDETATIHVPSISCTASGQYSLERIEDRFSMDAPDPAHTERNYTHTFSAEEETVTAWIWNEHILDGIAVYLKFSPKDFPYMTQWMFEDCKDYVAALEPANVPCSPRNKLREQNMLPMLAPGETRHFCLELGVVAGNSVIQAEIEKTNN